MTSENRVTRKQAWHGEYVYVGGGGRGGHKRVCRRVDSEGQTTIVAHPAPPGDRTQGLWIYIPTLNYISPLLMTITMIIIISIIVIIIIPLVTKQPGALFMTAR